MRKLIWFVVILWSWPLILAAQPKLSLPIACTLDENCFIQQFVDRDAGEGASDFMCGRQSYDGHKGTDFALNSLAVQAAGVDVIAAASGVVRGVRDELPDILYGRPGAPELNGRDCGNGVVIDHGDGWETQYCHLALGSVAVTSGARVERGAILGQVGLSGRTEFPHLHLSLRQNGATIDPFEPDGDPQCGADPEKSLWQEPVPAPAGGIITVGFSDAVPEFEDIKAGTAGRKALMRDALALVVWAYMFGSQVGDEVILSIVGPTGETFYADTVLLDRAQAQLFRAGGRRIPATGWIEGIYSGDLILRRAGQQLDRQTVTVQIGAQ